MCNISHFVCLISDEDFSPEDLFNMFFGGGFPEGHVAHRRQQRFRQQYTRTRGDEVDILIERASLKLSGSRELFHTAVPQLWLPVFFNVICIL